MSRLDRDQRVADNRSVHGDEPSTGTRNAPRRNGLRRRAASIQIDREPMEANVEKAVGKWRDLREVMEAPLQLTPEGKTYRFCGPVATGQLIA